MHQIHFAPMKGAALFVAITCTACANLPAHNNTLIFAVKRDIGINISTPSAAEPEVALSVGYKERQAAWVPLWANAQTGGAGVRDAMGCEISEDRKKYDCKHGAKFIADGEGDNQSNDTYSVFASFGGDVAVQREAGSGATAQAGLKLASFFATGVAAQQLSGQTGGLNLVSNADQENSGKKAVNEAFAQLRKLFQTTALGEGDHGKTVKVCLTKLGKEFNAQQAGRFEWVEGRSPKKAAGDLIAQSGLADEEWLTLSGIAYRLNSEAQAEVKKMDGDRQASNKPLLTMEEKAKAAADKACQ